MIRDEVLAMKPGRELDALVAEKVMLWRKRLYNGFEYWDGDGDKPLVDNWSPSTDIAAAWEVVEKMIERGGCEISCYGSKNGTKLFEVNVITMDGEVTVTAHTAPEAICKAALLLAVMDYD